MRIVRKNKNFSKKNFSDREEIWDFIVENGIATGDEVRLVIDINGYSEGSLNDIIYARTGFRSMEQYKEDQGMEDFACGGKGKKKFADEPLYMNPETGSVDTYEGWWYDELDDDGNYTGKKVNAVDLGEVVEVESDGEGGFKEKDFADNEEDVWVIVSKENTIGYPQIVIEPEFGEYYVGDEQDWDDIAKFESEDSYNQILQKLSKNFEVVKLAELAKKLGK